MRRLRCRFHHVYDCTCSLTVKPGMTKFYKETRDNRLYSTKMWRILRKNALFANPYCKACADVGITTLAIEVDHIKPHLKDPILFRDPLNLQSLCKPCHSRKTMTEINKSRYISA